MSNNAYSRFQETLKRCHHLVDLYQKSNNQDLLRAAVVLSVSGLDTYAVDRFMEKLVVFIRSTKITDETIRFLEAGGVTLRTAIDLLKCGRERPFRKIRADVEQSFGRRSYQSFAEIDGLYKVFGLKEISKRAEEMAHRTCLRRRLGSLLERRHQIVHAGDYNSRGSLQGIEKSWVEGKLRDLDVFVARMDEIVARKFRERT